MFIQIILEQMKNHTKYSYLLYWICDDQKRPTN